MAALLFMIAHASAVAQTVAGMEGAFPLASFGLVAPDVGSSTPVSDLLSAGLPDLGPVPASHAPSAWIPTLSPLQWVVPSPGLRADRSNNNVALALHEGRLYMAFRTAPTHFAGRQTRMVVVSSGDWGKHWTFETEVYLATDMREPLLLSYRGVLGLHFFEAGHVPTKFEPQRQLRMMRHPVTGAWSPPIEWGEPGEITWDMKVVDGVAYKNSYIGNHYQSGESQLRVLFETSDDGIHWKALPGAPSSQVYLGGVSETTFEFDGEGNLWGITRNEDGDASGYGSHLVFAPAARPWDWQFPSKSSPHRYDSPRMFRHGGEVYMIARRDIGGPFDLGMRWVPAGLRKWIFLAAYSLRPKRTSLYQVDRGRREVRFIMDLPSAGDTAFPSVVQVSEHAFLVANYSSPLDAVDRTWFWGQVSPQGTSIYFTLLQFVPSPIR